MLLSTAILVEVGAVEQSDVRRASQRHLDDVTTSALPEIRVDEVTSHNTRVGPTYDIAGDSSGEVLGSRVDRSDSDGAAEPAYRDTPRAWAGRTFWGTLWLDSGGNGTPIPSLMIAV